MVLYHCDYCSKDISNTIRVKCAVCTDFDLCVECFSVGVEIQQHRNDHAYQVMVCSWNEYIQTKRGKIKYYN